MASKKPADDLELELDTALVAAESTLEASAISDPVVDEGPVVYVVHTPGGIAAPEPLAVRGSLSVGRAPLDGGPALKRDKRASRVHATFSLDDTGGLQVENHSKNGTRVNGDPVEHAFLDDGAVVRVGDSLLVARARGPGGDADIPGLVGVSAEVRHIREQLALVAPSDAWVLILGPTGAGKEVVARAIHEVSGRPGPFIAVNCGAIPEQLAESQLFGHKKGAFTGAESDRAGYFEEADGGTLFLDELGELPAVLQPKLLRALDDRSVVRVGETRPRPIDVRVVAATNRDLEQDIEDGAFRADLFARLAEITLPLPALKVRKEDVLVLLAHFLPGDMGEVSADLAEALLLHPWPFNVRELKKVAKELEVRGKNQPRLGLKLIEHRLRAGDEDTATRGARRQGSPIRRAPKKRAPSSSPAPGEEELKKLVARFHGNVARVAREIGKSRKQTYRYLEKYGIDHERHRRGPCPDEA